jgi:hypothetical protein
VTGHGDEKRMLDIMVESITIPDAIKRQPGGKRNEFGQSGMRSSKPILHIGGEERPSASAASLGSVIMNQSCVLFAEGCRLNEGA